MFIKNVLIAVVLCVIFLGFSNCKKEEKPNILLITIDTLRRDHLGCYGYSLDTSPFIDRLAKNGIRFKNVITPLPLTSPSHASILTSLHPLIHQLIINKNRLDEKNETIAEVLKKNGYYTIGATAVGHLSNQFYFSQGFDSFSDVSTKKARKDARSINKSVINQIESFLATKKNKPLFIWVHYYDPHAPYTDWKKIVFNAPYKKDSPKYKEIRCYDKEIRYTDNHIEKLFQFLEKKGLSGKMIACITADHGEQLGEHGVFGDHFDFYSETSFVPLIFHGYKIPQKMVIEKYVSTMDIAATLLKLANIRFERSIDGVSLLKLDGKPADLLDREYLLIGNPLWVRSIQFISFPHSYIKNFDSFHRYWYVSRESNFPGEKFKSVPKDSINLKYNKKADGYEIRIKFPYILRKGINFAVLRFDVKKNEGVFLGYRIEGGRWSDPFPLNNKSPMTVTAFFPITTLAKITGYIGFKKGTKITDIRYSFLANKDFLKYSHSLEPVENKNLFNKLKSLRKFRNIDEIYNLAVDIKMKGNLFKTKKYPGKVIEWKKKMYNLLNYYQKEAKELLGEIKPKKPLSKKEKEMLKSLGYL